MSDDKKDDMSKKERQQAVLDELLGQTRFKSQEPTDKELEAQIKGEEAMDELSEEQRRLGIHLTSHAFNLREGKVRELIEQGAPINFIDEQSGATAIHFLAGYSREETVDFLINTGKCDLLIRDKMGRLPSARAAEITGNMELHAKLMKLELAQAEERGLTYNDLYGSMSQQQNLPEPGI